MDKKPAKKGRPIKKIDVEQVRALARLGCTYDEIADVLGMARSTFGNKLKQKDVREAYERGLSEGDVSIRRAQYDAAVNGKTAMLIWLGKNRLNQTDRVETNRTGADIASEFRRAFDAIDDQMNGSG
jgi:IS30 family transposase